MRAFISAPSAQMIMELSFVAIFAFLYALQISPAFWLAHKLATDEGTDSVLIMFLFFILPVTSQLGAGWITDRFF